MSDSKTTPPSFSSASLIGGLVAAGLFYWGGTTTVVEPYQGNWWLKLAIHVGGLLVVACALFRIRKVEDLFEPRVDARTRLMFSGLVCMVAAIVAHDLLGKPGWWLYGLFFLAFFVQMGRWVLAGRSSART